MSKSRSQRIGLLSEKERDLIRRADNRKALLSERDSLKKQPRRTAEDEKRIKEINRELEYISRRLPVLIKRLDRRIEALHKDLILLIESRSLKSLRVIRGRYFLPLPHFKGDYKNYPIHSLWDELHKPEFKEFAFNNLIPNYSTWKVKYTSGNPRKYWLDTKEKVGSLMDDVTEPEYALKGTKIRGVWKRTVDTPDLAGTVTKKFNVREVLCKALDLEMRFRAWISGRELPPILPKTQDSAQDISVIEDSIKHFEEKLAERKGKGKRA